MTIKLFMKNFPTEDLIISIIIKLELIKFPVEEKFHTFFISIKLYSKFRSHI